MRFRIPNAVRELVDEACELLDQPLGVPMDVEIGSPNSEGNGQFRLHFPRGRRVVGVFLTWTSSFGTHWAIISLRYQEREGDDCGYATKRDYPADWVIIRRNALSDLRNFA